MRRKKSAIIPIILTILLILAVCCLCIGLIALAGGAAIVTGVDRIDPFALPSPDPEMQDPTPGPLNTAPLGSNAHETLTMLEDTVVPINDPVDLAKRLGGIPHVPDVLIDPDAPYEVGTIKDFWVSNVDTNENFQITAELRYVGENCYFWIEDGVDYEKEDLIALGDTFDQQIIPTNRAFFGSEWNPGVDGDPHIYVLYAGGLGYSLAGYFSSADEVHPLAHKYSNAHEMFLINSDNVYLWEDYIYGTLAHEFQHMIHWYTDRNEATWMNEGFSMLAELINGYDVGGHDQSYLQYTDVQLTNWGDDVGTNSPYYGASYLFMAYFLDRFDEDATKALVAHPDNSMESIDLVMQELNIQDPQTSQTVTAFDVFRDWSITNLLLDPDLEDGRYDYGNYESKRAALTETISGFSPDSLKRNVHQFGVDSIRFTDLEGEYTLKFNGSTSVKVLPASAYSGSYAFYSNKGDESDMTLTQEFDFSGVSAPIQLEYVTWYDLEEDYDYLYLAASTDGEDWVILTTPSCTTLDPSGNSYGCGYNGATQNWIQEKVDLSQFAGERVTLRFEYVTDAAVNGEGFLLDDVQIDAIGYFSDFETDAGGWIPAGFARITNELPQDFLVTLILQDGSTSLTKVSLDETNTTKINLSQESKDEAILVISGITPYTNQMAVYEIELEQK